MKKFTFVFMLMLAFAGFTMAQTIADFESPGGTITINGMAWGTTGSMTVVPNPDPTGINTSSKVVKFVRPGKTNGGEAYSGFWSSLPVALDITVNKYVHVKVWKSRISPIAFKLENNTAGTTIQVFSVKPQTQTGAWEEVVFDFSAATGTTYPVIAFMPDFEDPLVQATDLTMYFDDIVVNNNPNPTIAVTFNVNMAGYLPDAGVKVYAAGNIFGNWTKPGDNPAFEMTDVNADGIYTISIVGTPGDYAFKFFKGAGWDGGEWAGGSDRTITVAGNTVLNCLWGQLGFVGKREVTMANKIQMYPNPVRDELTVNTTANISKVIITNSLGKVVGNSVFTNNKSINTSNFSKGLYFVTFVNTDGTKVTQKLIKD